MTVREMIEEIQGELEGELLALALRHEEMSADEAAGEFTRVTSSSVWRAIYVLANELDARGDSRPEG